MKTSVHSGSRGMTRVLAAAVISALGLAGNAGAQEADTARILFRVEAPNASAVNVVLLAGATADGDCVGMERDVTPKSSGGRDTVYAVAMAGNVSVRHGQPRQNSSAMIVSRNRGNVSLALHPQQYGEASVSLHTVNGKRILGGAASASKGAFSISRRNVAPGVYLLSVKGAAGNALSAKVAHSGGRLNISAKFIDESRSLGKQAAASDCGTWTLKLSADRYRDTTININLNNANIGAVRLTPITTDPPPPDDGDIGAIGCSREGLINAAKTYIKAMEAGDHTLMPLTSNARYIENDNQAKQSQNRVVAFGEGLWKTPLKPNHTLHFADVDSCASFSEVVYSTTTPQYINGVRIKVSGNQISEVFAVVTKTGDWLFNAPNYARYSSGENWGEIPAGQRLTRKQLLDGAEAYFAYFSNKSVAAPWGVPCARLEGGAYTGDGSRATCNVGVPDLSMRISTIWHLADVNHGMVVLYVFFGGPDTHMFRILANHGTDGGPGYRYIHTLTAMPQSSFTGAPPEAVTE